MEVFSVKQIWAVKPHSAFTDLIFFKGNLLVTFREGEAHVMGECGSIRIIGSGDEGQTFKTFAVFEKKGWDLRDPKLTLTPEGKLQIHFAALRFTPKTKKYKEGVSYTSFSEDGIHFSKLKRISEKNQWPWRITWFDKTAYVASYASTNPKDRKAPWIVTLMKSINGIDFTKVVTWPVGQYPNETTLRFYSNKKMVALLRAHEKGVKPWLSYNWIGTSFPPYTDWTWEKTSCHLGGPNFIIESDQKMIASGRLLYPTSYGIQERVAIAEMSENSLTPNLVLPSSGDSSYPGLIVKDKILFLSYYSTHEHKTAIYLAKVLLP